MAHNRSEEERRRCGAARRAARHRAGEGPRTRSCMSLQAGVGAPARSPRACTSQTQVAGGIERRLSRSSGTRLAEGGTAGGTACNSSQHWLVFEISGYFNLFEIIRPCSSLFRETWNLHGDLRGTNCPDALLSTLFCSPVAVVFRDPGRPALMAEERGRRLDHFTTGIFILPGVSVWAGQRECHMANWLIALAGAKAFCPQSLCSTAAR